MVGSVTVPLLRKWPLIDVGDYNGGMKTEERDAFDLFWEHVRLAEQDVRENAHRGHPPPSVYGDPWDKEFEEAYNGIRKYLRKFRKKRIFCPPPGVPMRPAPFTAETAHQALMYFLNKPDELYGSAKALDFPEYLKIKTEAQAELQGRQGTIEQSEAKSKSKRDKRSKHEKDLKILFDVLVGHVLSVVHEEHPKPLTWREIQDRLPQNPQPWSQAKISRVMTELFDAPGEAAEEYKRFFRSRERRRGFSTLDPERRRTVDAPVYDQPKDD